MHCAERLNRQGVSMSATLLAPARFSEQNIEGTPVPPQMQVQGRVLPRVQVRAQAHVRGQVQVRGK
jgi:hypothetical protein